MGFSVPAPGTLPMGWINTTLESIAFGENAIVDGPFGSNLKKSDYVSNGKDGVPVLTTKNLEGDYSPCSVRYISKDKFEELKRSQVKGGDILVAKIGSIGKTGIYPQSLPPAIIPANLLKFTVNPIIEFRYVYLYLNYYDFQKILKSISSATAQPAFNVTKFRKLFISLPPLPEQQRIVAKIDSLFSELDNGVAFLKTIKAQLVIYRQAVLKWAFEGKLTNSTIIKEEKLGKFIENPRYGTSKKCSYEDSGTKVYRIPNINYREGTILQDDLKYAVFSENEEEALRLKKDDILIIRSNGSVNLVGRASIVTDVDTDGIFAGYLMRLRIIADVLVPKFLLFYLSSFNARSYIETTAKSTSGVNNINSDEICKLKFPHFDKPEQLAIVSAIESRLSVCDKLEQTIDQTLALSASLRQSILKKAFEGRLVPQDPNDEPAEKLLERINAQKQHPKDVYAKKRRQSVGQKKATAPRNGLSDFSHSETPEKTAVLTKQKQTRKRGRK